MSKKRRTIFATTLILGLSLAAAAAAQTAPKPACPTNPNAPPVPGCPQNATAVTEVVVTGSRIRTTDFTSPSPITVITPEEAQLQGTTDIAQLLQHSVIANNAVQINNFFTGFIVTGGPGVNTLSLRGLGAQRTLFLIDGQRLGPAGVGGTVGPVDLNTLNFPQAEISQIQILKDGASSIYGSDAIGGVVNLITKENVDGGDIRAFYGPSQDGGANFYQLDGTWGKTWSRGYVLVGASWYKQTALTYGERPYLSCSSDDATFLTGGSADLIDPVTGRAKCNNIFAPAVADVGFGPQLDYVANPNAVAGGGFMGGDVNGFQLVNQVVCNNPGIFFAFTGACDAAGVNVAATRASEALLTENAPIFLKSDALSPDERYFFNVHAGFDLTPHAQIYGSVMLTRRDSSQFGVSQFFSFVNPGNPFNPGFALPIPIIPQPNLDTQQVDYGRATLGVKGDFPDFGIFKHWNYDLYGEFSQSHGYYSETFALADRVNATTWAGPGTGDATSMPSIRSSVARAWPKPSQASPASRSTSSRRSRTALSRPRNKPSSTPANEARRSTTTTTSKAAPAAICSIFPAGLLGWRLASSSVASRSTIGPPPMCRAATTTTCSRPGVLRATTRSRRRSANSTCRW